MFIPSNKLFHIRKKLETIMQQCLTFVKQYMFALIRCAWFLRFVEMRARFQWCFVFVT